MKRKLLFVLSGMLAVFLFCGMNSANAVEAKIQASGMQLQSKSAVLMSSDTGEVLFESNADERRPIASMVKIMTLLLCFENADAGKISYDDTVTISERSASMGGSQAFLDAGSQYKADDLIKSIAVASANDSCVAMAEHISGSVESFVEQMNNKANQLGMENTVFVNCTGLPVVGQFSTARDVGKMFNELIKHQDYFRYTKIWMDDFVHPSGRVTGLTNTNKLIRQYNGCDAGKTGYTAEAKHCLAATAMRNDMRLVSVIVGGPDSSTRFNENKMLFDYGFANYQSKPFLKKGEKINEEVSVSGGKSDTVKAEAEQNLNLFGKKGEQKGELVIELEKNVKAPVAKGDVVGKAYIKDGETVLKEVNLVATETIEKANYFDSLNNIIKQW
jgi:D-alanyl-D-alanine carboxypeptidase (penicillin-binding protein 5/6)